MAKYMGYNSEGKMGGGGRNFQFSFPFALLELEGGKNEMLNTAKETQKMQSSFFSEAERILFSRS